MSGLAFFDSNILLYAEDAHEPAKRAIAIELIDTHAHDGTFVISLQVLQEYFNGATRKLRRDVEDVHRSVESYAGTRVICFQPHDVVLAIELHRLYRTSFWDALILHAARLAGCHTLYSEDLQPGAMIAGVHIVNPFQTTRLRPSPTPRGRKPH